MEWARTEIKIGCKRGGGGIFRRDYSVAVTLSVQVGYISVDEPIILN